MSDAQTITLAPSPRVEHEELLQVEDLNVSFTVGGTQRQVVHGVSFDLRPGRALAIVGESGSGKTVTARSLLGLNGDGATVTATRRHLLGRDVRRLSERQWRHIRGRDVGYVLQDALVSLDPLRTVAQEVGEALVVHRSGDRKQRAARVLEVLERAGVPEPEVRQRQLPGQLSGGLRQRALIAQAIALGPRLLVADEPTTALDVTVQAQVLDLLASLKADGTGVVLISHDLAVVGRVADEVLVMQEGRVVEQGPVSQVLGDPQHPYTRRLLAAVPRARARGGRLSDLAPAAATPRHGRVTALSPESPALVASHLIKSYTGADKERRTVVDDVSFVLPAGRTLGIVGESGSGKSTTARIAMGLVSPDSGSVALGGHPWVPGAPSTQRPLRRELQVVHQDPLSSFDPRHTVARILLDALDAGGTSRADRAGRVRELMDWVALSTDLLTRRPLQLSGGQRQRVAIARALAVDPRVLVLDEPVSALDVSIQAQVLDLLADLQRQLSLSYLFISHDLGVIHHVSDEVLVMQSGRVVEQGPVTRVFEAPEHPYTQTLLASVVDLPEVTL